MTPENITTEEARKGAKILLQAELEFKKKFYNHFSHNVEKAYWAYEGCNECYYELIKDQS